MTTKFVVVAFLLMHFNLLNAERKALDVSIGVAIGIGIGVGASGQGPTTPPPPPAEGQGPTPPPPPAEGQCPSPGAPTSPVSPKPPEPQQPSPPARPSPVPTKPPGSPKPRLPSARPSPVPSKPHESPLPRPPAAGPSPVPSKPTGSRKRRPSPVPTKPHDSRQPPSPPAGQSPVPPKPPVSPKPRQPAVPLPAPQKPPESPQQSEFPNLKQYMAYLVIQRFKRTITCDPHNVTASWVGNRVCAYRGFYCASPPDSPSTPTIASVDFNGFGLCAPTMVGFIDELPDLAIFHSNSNNFSGAIPDLTGLKYLYELDVSNNNHNGAFPAAVLPLANLIFLDLRFNSFAGSVPAMVFDLGLDVLFLNDNAFDQPLPSNLGSSPVEYLTLANNRFTGPIPRSIANLSSTLVEVLFLNNKLSGCLPYEVGLLNNATVFDAGFNELTGPIPWSFGCMQKVEQLNLAGNLLYGEVPDVVCRLAADGGALVNLSLSGNYFTSLGQSCRELIKSNALDVRQNCIVGLPEQRPAAVCAQFLLRKMNCPSNPHIPCSISKCPLTPPLLTGQASRGRSSAPSLYVTYQKLHKPPGSN